MDVELQILKHLKRSPTPTVSIIDLRYIREIIYGKRNRRTYWEITTDPETMPANSTYECDD